MAVLAQPTVVAFSRVAIPQRTLVLRMGPPRAHDGGNVVGVPGYSATASSPEYLRLYIVPYRGISRGLLPMESVLRLRPFPNGMPIGLY